jgi:transposase
MDSLGVSPKALAAHLGVDLGTVYSWMQQKRRLQRSRSQHRTFVTQMSKLFKVPESDIWGDEEFTGAQERRVPYGAKVAVEQLLDLMVDDATPAPVREKLKQAILSLMDNK